MEGGHGCVWRVGSVIFLCDTNLPRLEPSRSSAGCYVRQAWPEGAVPGENETSYSTRPNVSVSWPAGMSQRFAAIPGAQKCDGLFKSIGHWLPDFIRGCTVNVAR